MEQTLERRTERMNDLLFGVMLAIVGVLLVFAVIA